MSLRTLLLVVALGALLAPVGAVALGGALADPEEAKETLATARRELEEVVGRERLDEEPPPLPRVGDLELPEDDWRRWRELSARPLDEWTGEDAAWVQTIVDGNGLALGELAAEGRPVAAEEPESIVPIATRILQASRLAHLRDLLALRDGDLASFDAGLGLRLDLAERLTCQPLIIAPIIGTHLALVALGDLREAAVRAEIPGPTLERLDGLLLRWQGAPDPGAVLARWALGWLDRGERLDAEGRFGSAVPGLRARQGAAAAELFVELARGCREDGCGPTIDTLRRRIEESDGADTVAALLLPNFFDFLHKREVVDELVELARAALALRLLALEEGAYPRSLDRLPAALAAGRNDLPGLRYRPRGAAGARLALAVAERTEPWPAKSSAREAVQRLLVWELPPVAGAERSDS